MYIEVIHQKGGDVMLVREKILTAGNKRKSITVENLGYVRDYLNQFNDPVAHFKELYKNKSSQIKKSLSNASTISLTIDTDETLSTNTNLLRNLGYGAFKRLYKSLKLDTFWKKYTAGRKFDFDVEKIFYLLVISRLMDPGSKKYTFDSKEQYFEPIEGFELEDVYRALDIISEFDEELQSWIFHHSKTIINRDTDICYYDGTNFYFDIARPDMDEIDDTGVVIEKKLRKRGPEKNKRPDPIVNMGLLVDHQAIPISYTIYPGNESEKVHMLPVIQNARKHAMIDRIINVADRGLNTSENIWHLCGKNEKESGNMDGYVYGKSVKGADSEFKEWALNKDGYKTEYINPDNVYNEDEDINQEGKVKFIYKIRNQVVTLKVHVEMKDGSSKIKKVNTSQRQLVYYSEKYALKQKHDRNIMIERAKDLIQHPKKYDKVTAAGSGAYIKNIQFDKNTGEITSRNLVLDLDKITEEEKYDGYYAIVTSEINLSPYEIRDIYRGLIRIEHTFRITKSELEARPIYLWTTEHIKAHFTVCYTALCMLKILMKILDDKYTAENILTSLKKCTVSELTGGYWQANYYDEILDDISKKLDIQLDKRFRTREEIRRVLRY